MSARKGQGQMAVPLTVKISRVLGVSGDSVGHDQQTRSSVILFDQDKPSETAYRLSDKLVKDLAQGLMKVMQALSVQPTDKPH
jgi:hypothetical protein